MWSERRPTSRSAQSSYSNNFQLLKIKNLQMRLNPEQAQSLTQKSSPSTPRYDRQQRIPHNKFRVHRQKYRNNGKTESGKTVYEIYNIRGKSDIDSSSNNSLSGTSQVFSHRNRHGLLKLQRSQQQPLQYKYSQYSQQVSNKPKKLLRFQQRKWDMNQTTKNVQCNVGSIRSQQFKRQTPLSPGKIESQINLTPIIQENGNCERQQKNQNEEEQDEQLPASHDTPMKLGHKYRLSVQKQLVQKLNTQTRYMRYRHNEKLKKALKSNQSIFISKQPSSNKIDRFTLKFGDPIQTILRIMHHNSAKSPGWETNPLIKNMNKNKLKITIQIPQFFYQSPDPYLSSEQLKFKGINYMEEYGIISPQNSEKADIKVIKHPQSFMFQYDRFMEQQNSEFQFTERKMYCINWYRDDSVYMGEIINDFREGIGMEWVPGVYVYYGQYKSNFRHGYGVMKHNDMKTYVGTWAYDHYHGYGKVISAEGEVIQTGTFRNSQLKQSNCFNELS